MKPRVLVTHPLVEGGLDPLEGSFQVEVGDGLCGEPLVSAIAEADALIPLLTVPITGELLDGAPRLKVVANCAVGHDNIDLAAATARGIWVTNTPGVLTESTADLTWAVILSLVRKVIPGHAMVTAGRFEGWSPTLMLGMELGGKTLGIVGLGQIGRAVARRAAGFRMNVIFHDPDLGGDQDLGLVTARRADLERLLRSADIVSLHAPLNEQTFHLIDAERLDMMRPGAFLINTARGPLVDEAALVRRLGAGTLAGAGLDVFEHEPALAPGLARLENVLLLPHLGSATRETRLGMARLAAENARAALEGRRPPNALNDVNRCP